MVRRTTPDGNEPGADIWPSHAVVTLANQTAAFSTAPEHQTMKFSPAAPILRALLFAFAMAGVSASALAGHDSGGPTDEIALEMITTNLAPDPAGDRRFIQVGIQLKLSDPHEGEAVKAWMPKIRSEILMTLCGHTPSSLAGAEARLALVDELRDTVNKVVGGGEKDKHGKIEGPVADLLFTYFLIP